MSPAATSTRATRASAPSASASTAALAVIARTRSDSVSSPLSSSQALNGDRLGPVLRTNGCSVFSTHSFVPSTAPPSTRPCPSMCLVQE